MRNREARQIYSFRHMMVTLGGVALLWMVAYSGHASLLPAFGVPLSYSTTPLLSTAYFLAWIAVAFALFPRTLQHIHLSQSVNAYVLLAVFLSATAFFYSVLLPLLPAYGTVLSSPNSFLSANPEFIVPKLAEITFQQILITATVLSIASFERNIVFVSLMYAVLFVFTHISTLIELSSSEAAVLSFGAVCSAFFFPYLLLRVRNGFVYTFMIHVSFYIVLTIFYLS